MNKQLSVVDLGKKWSQAIENFTSMKSTFAELASHPQVTDEQILHAARRLGAVRNSLWHIRRKVVMQHQSKSSSMPERMVIDRIMRTKL